MYFGYLIWGISEDKEAKPPATLLAGEAGMLIVLLVVVDADTGDGTAAPPALNVIHVMCKMVVLF
jgi:hypothetical protein